MLVAPLQRLLGYAGLAAQRIENALWRVNTVEILGNFAAEKSLRHRLRGIALNFHRASFIIHRDKYSAGVRAIVRADGVNNPEWSCQRGIHDPILS